MAEAAVPTPRRLRRLHVQVQSATNLRSMNKMFGNTPYIRIRLEPPSVPGGGWQRTDAVNGDTNPCWQLRHKSDLQLPLGDDEEVERSVVLQIWDENIVSDDLIGSVSALPFL